MVCPTYLLFLKRPAFFVTLVNTVYKDCGLGNTVCVYHSAVGPSQVEPSSLRVVSSAICAVMSGRLLSSYSVWQIVAGDTGGPLQVPYFPVSLLEQ